MRRDLTDAEMDELLQRQLYGHIACVLPDGSPYVLPITYAYHRGDVYGFSFDGERSGAMRKNKSVCFQTEQFISEGVWRSVVVWGEYEELSGKAEAAAMKVVFSRLDREKGMAISPVYHQPGATAGEKFARLTSGSEAIFYRIKTNSRTGRQVQYD